MINKYYTNVLTSKELPKVNDYIIRIFNAYKKGCRVHCFDEAEELMKPTKKFPLTSLLLT